jgi:hypothetical protein
LIVFLASESLAKHYEQRGDLNGAVQTLEAAARKNGMSTYGLLGATGYFGMRNLLELDRLYRQLGRHSEAEKVEADLRKLLLVADPDHPILLELQRRREAAAAQPTP